MLCQKALCIPTRLKILIVEDAKPYTFFNVKGAQLKEEGKYSFSAGDNFYVLPAVGSKADRLQAEAVVIGSAEKIAFDKTRKSDSDKDYTIEPGAQASCRILRRLLSKTNVDHIDNEETTWQNNFCHVLPPTVGATIMTNKGDRLWPKVVLVDRSGQLSLYMSEKAALGLTGYESS